MLQYITKEMSGLQSTEEREAGIKPLNTYILDIVKSTVLEAEQEQVEIGDSFGFPQTRINTQGGPNTFQGVEFRLKLPRICPGFDTTIDTLTAVAQRIIEKLDNSSSALQDTLHG